jgi:hypothetical protein
MIKSKRDMAVVGLIGAMLLFAIAITAIVIYQQNAVPVEERSNEIRHQSEVREQMTQFRSAVLSSSSDGSSSSTEIDIGLRYSNGILGIIQDDYQTPSTGLLENSNYSEKIKVRNAQGVGASSNYWNGGSDPCEGPNHCYSTSVLQYTPDYRRYQLAPSLNYENTVVYDELETVDGKDYVIRSGQSLINGRNLNLVTLTGNISISQEEPVTLDILPVSASENTITVTNDSEDEPLELDIPTNLPVEVWRNRLLNEQLAENNSDGFVKEIEQVEDNLIRITMVKGESYDLKLSRMEIMTRSRQSPTPDTEPAYVAWESGNRQTIREGQVNEIPAQVRDKYNNPKSGVPTVAWANDTAGECFGSFESANQLCEGASSSYEQPGRKVSGDNGRVTYYYNSPEVTRDKNVNIVIKIVEDTLTSNTVKKKLGKLIT